MNIIKIVVLILLASITSSAAVGNPQMRACRVTGGQFTTVLTDMDQLGMCRYGQALVGSIDILNKDDSELAPLSIENYRDGILDCEAFNLTSVRTSDGKLIQVCRYNDGSIIDLVTLSRGRYDFRNQLLNKALGF